MCHHNKFTEGLAGGPFLRKWGNMNLGRRGLYFVDGVFRAGENPAARID